MDVGLKSSNSFCLPFLSRFLIVSFCPNEAVSFNVDSCGFTIEAFFIPSAQLDYRFGEWEHLVQCQRSSEC